MSLCYQSRPVGRLSLSVAAVGILAGTATAGSISEASIFVDVLEVNGSPGFGAVGSADTIQVMDGDVITFGINVDITTVTGATSITGGIFALANVGAFGTAQNVDPDGVFEPTFSLSKVFDDNAIEIQETLPGGSTADLGLMYLVATFEFVVDATSGSFSYDALTTTAPTTGGANVILYRSAAGGGQAAITEITADTIRIIPTPASAAILALAGVVGGTRRRR